MNFLQQALSFIFTAANWGGPAGLAARILEHLQYTAVAVVFSALIAVPLGMLIGHTGRGTFLVVTGVNALRALPTLGVLLLGVLLWGLGLVPPTVALMLLGIPPLLAGTYSGIANVDRAVVDAATLDGHDRGRVLLRVEMPNAMPLILGGLRTATLQIVATATVAAYASLGGLGRYLIDGIKVRQFYIALVGALMVTALALILDAALAFAVWASVPGSGRLRRMPQPLLGDEVALESGAASGSRAKSTSQPLRTRGSVAYGRWVSADSRSTQGRLAGDLDLARARRSANGIGAGAAVRQPHQGLRPDRRGGHGYAPGVLRVLRPGHRRDRGNQATLDDRHTRRAGTAAVHRPRRGEHVAGAGPPGPDQPRRLRGRAGRRRDLQPVLQRAADPAHRAVQRTDSVACRWSTCGCPTVGQPATISYSSAPDGIKLHSPVADTTVTVDSDGFILDYPGLAERI